MEFNFEERQGEGLRSRLPPDASPDLLDLLHRMLSYEPHARISAGEALRHPFFQEVVENELEMEKSALQMTSMSHINTNRFDHSQKDYMGRKQRNPGEKLHLPLINSHTRDRSNDGKTLAHKKSTIMTHKVSLKSSPLFMKETFLPSYEKTPRKKPFKPQLGMLLEGKRMMI